MSLLVLILFVIFCFRLIFAVVDRQLGLVHLSTVRGQCLKFIMVHPPLSLTAQSGCQDHVTSGSVLDGAGVEECGRAVYW